MSQTTPTDSPDQDTVSLAPPASPSDAVLPLALGTILLDRYTIVELLAGDSRANVYRVADMQRCPVCNVENDGSAVTCGFCGNPLPSPATRRIIQQPAPENIGLLPPASFLVDGHVYTVVRDSESAAGVVPRAMHITFGYQTDPGVQRGATGDPNQDALFVLQLASQNAASAPSINLAIVADGIGGAQAGQEASRIAVQTIFSELNAGLIVPLWDGVALNDVQIRAILQQSINNANSHLIEWANANAWQSGTTVTLVLVLDARAYIVNIGDSRTYFARSGELTQITRDHSFIARLIANGAVAAQDIYTHPQRNLILKSLGDPTGYEMDIFPETEQGMKLEAGDRFLLCSDGLWEMVRDPEIADVLLHTRDPQLACAQLVNLANLGGGADNITVIVVGIDSL